MRILIITVFVAIISGCFAGGIAQRHNPYDNAVINGKYIISLELRAPGGNAARGFKSADIIIDGERHVMNKVESNEEQVTFNYSINYKDVQGKIPQYDFVYHASSGDHAFKPANPTKPVE